MIRKRWLVLSACISAVLLAGWLVWLASAPEEVDSYAAAEIRMGTPVGEAIRIMGRDPDRTITRPADRIYILPDGREFRPAETLCLIWESKHVYVQFRIYEGVVVDGAVFDEREGLQFWRRIKRNL